MEQKQTAEQRLSTYGRIGGAYLLAGGHKTKSKVLICACGNKYLKTRERQKMCLRCVAYHLK
jgi:hypothetical protein